MFIERLLSGYSKNLRKEIRKQDKFYFYDLGIRNAVELNRFAVISQKQVILRN